jgi:hypothetical protein
MGPDVIKEIMRDQSIARPGRSDEIAASVLWLCSPCASFVLGVASPVDGGFTALWSDSITIEQYFGKPIREYSRPLTRRVVTSRKRWRDCAIFAMFTRVKRKS